MITTQLGVRLLDRADRELDDALVVVGAGALLVLLGGDAEQQHGRDARARATSPASSTAWEIESRSMPGIASIGVAARRRRLDEHRVDEVARRSARVSRTMSRSTPVLRSRRRRVAGKAIGFRSRLQSRAKRRRANRACERRRSASVSAARWSSGPPMPPALFSAASIASSVGLNGNSAEIDADHVVERRRTPLPRARARGTRSAATA